MKNLDLSKIFVVEYSVSQKCFHIDNITKSLKNNLKMFINETLNDYMILGLFDSIEKADDFITELKMQNLENKYVIDNFDKFENKLYN